MAKRQSKTLDTYYPKSLARFDSSSDDEVTIVKEVKVVKKRPGPKSKTEVPPKKSLSEIGASNSTSSPNKTSTSPPFPGPSSSITIIPRPNFEEPHPDRKEIRLRGRPPAFVKIKKKKVSGSNEGGGSVEQRKSAFYKLAREEIVANIQENLYSDPDVLSQQTPPVAIPPEAKPLTSEEREAAFAKIKLAGDEGLPIEGTEERFIWKEKCAVSFQQTRPRVSDQFAVRVKNGKNGYQYLPICTNNDCYSTSGTKADESHPKCLTHKGPVVGYAVYESLDKKDKCTNIGHLIMNFMYAEDNKDEHMQQAFSNRSNKPKGTPAQPEVFETCEEAEKRLAVLQTVALLKSLWKPSLYKYTAPVYLANGLEREVKKEMDKQGFKLELIGQCKLKDDYSKLCFPLGRRAKQGETIANLLTDDTGALYVICDEKIVYGGQTRTRKNTHEPSKFPTDTVALYEKEFGTGTLVKIPLCAVKIAHKKRGKKEDENDEDALMKMEAHLHIILYIAYLFKLRNPFHPTFSKTHPYCLNKEVMSKYFDESSWEIVSSFFKSTYGCKFQFMVDN